MNHPERGSADETSHAMSSDPVLQMIGVGREIWQDESGDQFIKRLRSEWSNDDFDDSEIRADRQIQGPIA